MNFKKVIRHGLAFFEQALRPDCGQMARPTRLSLAGCSGQNYID